MFSLVGVILCNKGVVLFLAVYLSMVEPLARESIAAFYIILSFASWIFKRASQSDGTFPRLPSLHCKDLRAIPRHGFDER